ncbi:MAG TPA: hypothetical protein VGS62_09190, partial [Streptosporangiaceae bacterium]|nr:hypothetical protein [Streptosporangiaceae bacterium]
SANRTARAAEESLLAGLRPVLMPSRRDETAQKIMFGDEQWFKLPAGATIGEIRTVAGVDTVYLAMSLHNAGSGLAVIHGWRFYPERSRNPDQDHPPPEKFRRNVRDLFVPVNDTGFWQAAFRDPADPEYRPALEAIKSRTGVSIDLLYGDHEGGQRVITRFSVMPGGDDGLWYHSTIRHWNLDRPDPR